MLIGSVADLLQEREILVVPDRCWNRVPFAALRDKNGKYLSETFRIRIVPSLTTLKLIQDSPADYHNRTGALIVGDPDVGRVRYKGSKTKFSRFNTLCACMKWSGHNWATAGCSVVVRSARHKADGT